MRELKTTKDHSRAMLSPKQEMFLQFYYNVNSPTFANAYKSALEAGYRESYARVMTSPTIKNMWMRENNRVSLTPEHITTLVEKIAVKGHQEKDQLRALELLAKMNGLVIDRSENKNLNIETSLAELK